MNKLNSLYILAILWTLWCFLHSVLISSFFTTWMKKTLGAGYGYYRLTYNAFSLVTLVPVVIYQIQIPEEINFAWPYPWNILKAVMYLASFILFYGGYRVYDMRYMLGMRQIQEMRHEGKTKEMEIKRTGILGYVRHPWYSGAILIVWAFGSISDVSLVSKIILTVYIITGTFLEEKKLIREIGEPYLEYRKKVPMLIPWKRS